MLPCETLRRFIRALRGAELVPFSMLNHVMRDYLRY
jgi:hypothetical protein